MLKLYNIFVQNMKIMRKVFLFSIAIGVVILGQLRAQNNVGIGTTTPHASALLDLTATDKGLLIPRVALVAANNGTTPVNGPATGLLVYNTGTGGLTPAGFYYWNGSQWVQIGAGSGSSCVTLDQAYNCGGNGAGRTINALYGSVTINVTSLSTSTEALKGSVANGTNSAPTVALYGQHTGQYGVGVYGETTLSNNLFPGVAGSSSANNANTSIYPAGVSGYFEGSGIGAGVWGESDANVSGSGSNTGVYGYGFGNKSFGGRFYSRFYPGLDVTTGANSSGVPAVQFYSTGANISLPALLSVGFVQFTVSNNVASSILLNNLAGEPTIAPNQPDYGYLGTSTTFWYRGYAQAWNQVSRRELKRSFQSLSDEYADLAMNDIRQMKPTFYKYKNEKDEYDSSQPSKTRYNYHLGFIVDEVPDYIKDNTFMAIDLYALGSLAITGVQNVDKRLQQLEQHGQVSDFGTASMQGNEIRIEYSAQFKQLSLQNVPVVSITPTTPGARFYIKSQDRNGFTLVSENGPMSFNWMAVARVAEKKNNNQIPADVLAQIRIDETKKKQMMDWANSLKQPPLLQLVGHDTDPSQHRTMRIKTR